MPGAFALIFACYVPVFLIMYPGSFSYDSMTQVQQIASGEYSTFHPLAHTLLIRFCLSFYDRFQSMETCGALYAVMQMLLVSFCFAQVCASLARSVSRRAARLTVFFFALYPAHMAFASNCTKDVLFSASFVLFAALCLETYRCGGLACRQKIMLIVSGAAACLLRNNMIYAMAVWMGVLLLGGRAFRRQLGYAALVLALAFGVQAGLKAATHAADGRRVEMLSVPLQQLSRARMQREDVFSEEEKLLMDELFADVSGESVTWSRYEPTLSDLVKNRMDDTVVRARFGELMGLWAAVGVRCPGVYLDAFLELMLPALYPYREYKVVHSYIELAMGRALTAPFALEPIVQPGRFAAIREFLYERIYKTGADDVPVVRWLFNIGGVFWLLLALYLYDLYRGDWARAAVLLLPVLLYGTYLLGPVMQGRYLYPFICALPLFAARTRHIESN